MLLLLYKHKGYRVSWVFLFLLMYIGILTNVSNIIHNSLMIRGQPFIYSSLYVYFHTLVIYYLISRYKYFITAQQLKLSKLFFSLLVFNSSVAVLLYLLYLVGLNEIKFGVNHFTAVSQIPRAFGLLTEPSIFSIVSFITLYSSFSLGKSLYLKGFLFLAFVLSFSTTGMVFAVVTIFFLPF